MSSANKGLSSSYLKAILDYSDTGSFAWKWRSDVENKVNGRFFGRNAGHTAVNGYVHVRINGRLYRAHRLAWLWTTGEWPSGLLDHVNGDPTDNRFENLRLATDSQNGANRGPNKNNKVNLKGVCWAKRERRWRATITVQRKQSCLGYYTCPAAAHFAYIIAADRCFGEFSRSA